MKNSWLDPIETAGIPAIESGIFPKAFLRYGGAIIQVSPWLVDINTDRVKPADVPRSWEDILAPRFKGKILLNDPKSADSYLDMWATLADAFGESFFARLRAQNIRWYADGVPAVQALAAGEGDIFFPGVRYLVQGMVDKGAPLDTAMLDPTSGVEMFAAVSARGKSRAPNAARLFAHFLLSPEGNKVFNQDPGNTSPYNRGELPKNYVSPKPETPARRAEIRQLLGLQ